MTHPSRLFSDLQRNADDRLETWARDTAMRCEAIDLPESEAISMLISVLLGRTIQILKSFGMKREDLLILVQQTYDQVPSEVPKDRASPCRKSSR